MICKFNTCGTCFNCYSKNFSMDCFPCEDADPMTNADRIRAMSDEELAEFLYQVGYDNGWGMKEYALEWLQQPAEEDKHEPN